MSLLFDESARMWKQPANDDTSKDETPPALLDCILSKEKIQVEVKSFKESLLVGEADIC